MIDPLCIIYYITMGIKDKLFNHQKIQFDLHFHDYLLKIFNAIPDIFKSPLQMLQLSLYTANMFIEFVMVLIMIGQTVHVLSSKEKKIINIRHLLVKWTTVAFIYCIRQFAKESADFPEGVILVYNMVAFGFSYPSKAMRNIYIKIFSMSERKKNDDFIENQLHPENSLYIRMMVSFTLFLLNLSKFIITFLPIHNRKPIEESIKGLNLVIVEEKYFWKLYENTFSSSNTTTSLPSELFNSSTINVKAPYSFMKQSTSMDMKESTSLKNTSVTKKNGLKENKLSAEAQEMILISFGSNMSGQNRKFSFYRNVQIMFYIESSQLILINEQDKRTQAHSLSELEIIQDDIVQFICEDQTEPIFIKFKAKKDKQDFIAAIHLENFPS